MAAVLVPAIALAHPLGNFTINHYAGVRIEPDRILLDVVIDQAEIPTFQARLDLDIDADGQVSDEEIDAGRTVRCEDLAGSLDLRVGQVAETLTLTEAGLTFPPGAGGLPTMRQVCGFRVDLAAPLSSGTSVAFADTSHRGAARLARDRRHRIRGDRWRRPMVASSRARASRSG